MKEKKKKKRVKKWIGRLHLWLGLSSGIVVFIVAITGCIFAFQDEIQDLIYDWRMVPVEERQFVAPAQLFEKTEALIPGSSADYVMYYGKDRPAYVYVAVDETPYFANFNPYSGEVLHVQNLNEDFFKIIENLHMYLLLPQSIGKQIVGISTLVFIVMLLTGIILWWPKKKKQLGSHLKVKWSARWRRVNYDLHRTAGIYAAIIALILAITGLGIAYEWMHESFYSVANLGQEYPDDHKDEIISEIPDVVVPEALNKALYATMEKFKEDQMFFVWNLGVKKAILTGAYPTSLIYDHQSNMSFHPKTGEVLSSYLYRNKSPGLKLQEMTYSLHTGQYLGLFGKFLAFLTSLFVAGLPVSGLMIWWGRRTKKKRFGRN
ncbi:PepSY-associated TM helix domain-containing protein [Flavimarina sp. Hel_I_48]|uniref:PepSY-associated TM helix domain-containing protein n=1 Tax=Flavimarina sp. Hel_I_48 TaxID=1392488 RepID=UPI00069128E1|nr:PepSY-associated TM helix domain-containing protein [Flavimarina sp. Hel_I_48]